MLYARLSVGLLCLAAATAFAEPVYQPPGSDLTYGDVTHGQRIQSASGNPAAAAADLALGADNRTRGNVLSVAAGLEYENVQELFDTVYTMDRQLKLEALTFSSDRRWSAHIGLDAKSATDPLGDDYQWLTLRLDDKYRIPDHLVSVWNIGVNYSMLYSA